MMTLNAPVSFGATTWRAPLFEGTHKVMTLNANQFLSVQKPGKPRALAKVIQSENPDVVALQEVGNRALLEAFNKDFLKGRYPTIVRDVSKPSSSLGNALMAKAGIHILSTQGHGRGACKDGGACPNPGALEVFYETPEGYRLQTFINHFRSARGPHLKNAMLAKPRNSGKLPYDEYMALRSKDEKATMRRRLREAKGIAARVETRLKGAPDTDVLVMGDFNTNHTTRYGQPVLEAVSLANHPDPAFRLSELMLRENRPDPTHDGHEKFPDSKMDYMGTRHPRGGHPAPGAVETGIGSPGPCNGT